MLGISGHAVREYECGAKRLPAGQFAAVSLALGVPMSLFFYEGDLHTAAPAEEEMTDTRWLALRRPPSILLRPDFSHVLPVVRLWKETRGELTADARRAVAVDRLFQRTILVRHVSSSRLVIEHLGPGIGLMRPCEALTTVGQDFDEHHLDREYVAWVATAYAETSWSRHIRVESIRASIRTSATTTLRTRYDRVLLPWRSKDEPFVMALSLRREMPVATRSGAIETCHGLSSRR